MSQHAKIIDLCKDGRWHCQAEFWPITKSPHKRRIEIEGRKNEDEQPTGEYVFDKRTCPDIQGSHDFLMRKNPNYIPPEEPKESYYSPPKPIKRTPHPFQVAAKVEEINQIPVFKERKVAERKEINSLQKIKMKWLETQL